MESTEKCEVIIYDEDLNKVRCPICNKAVHGALDIEDDYEPYDWEWDLAPCEHFYFCEVFSHGLEFESEAFKEVKASFEHLVQKWADEEVIDLESFALAFPKWTSVIGSKLLYLKSQQSIGGIDVFYAFVPDDI